MQSRTTLDQALTERPGYFEIGSQHLYTVLHEVQDPVARVLLVGPFAPERHHAYIPWVRWARYLAARQIEVLRFDFRGVGESTGIFEQMTFAHWREDVQQLVIWLRERSPAVPFLLHGLSMGALLAALVFEAGSGDGLLLWSPPKSANAVLRMHLLNWITLQRLSSRAEEHKPFATCVKQMEGGASLEVNGYWWSADLWKESFEFPLPAPYQDPAVTRANDGRPVRVATLNREASPLIRGGLSGYEEGKDLEWLFAPNFEWLSSTADTIRGQRA